MNKAEEEGGQVAPVDIFTGGTPKTGLVFVLETYSTGTTNGEDNYYKLRVKDTQQYVYFTADRHLKIGVSNNTYIYAHTHNSQLIHVYLLCTKQHSTFTFILQNCVYMLAMDH